MAAAPALLSRTARGHPSPQLGPPRELLSPAARLPLRQCWKPRIGGGRISSGGYKRPVFRASLKRSFENLGRPEDAQVSEVRATSLGSAPSSAAYAESKSTNFVERMVQSLIAFVHQTRAFFLHALSQWKRPIAAALVFLSFAVCWPQMALAAKGGGRMGGRSFSGRSSSQTYSAPSHGGYSGPAYSAPIYSAPYYAPSPIFGGFYNPPIFIGRRGPSILGLIVFSLTIFLFFKIATNYFLSSQGAVDSSTVSVVRLQVGLLGLARTLQRDLERIAERADASTPEGLHYILSETLLSLMRHPDYCVYARTTSEVKSDVDEIESAFNRLSMEERGKFSEETLVNVGNIRRRVNRAPKAERFANEFIVVTVLVAVDGKVQLPEVKSGTDLKESLSLLGSFTEDRLQAVEILWTPQNEEDTLSERELMQDYPNLNVLL